MSRPTLLLSDLHLPASDSPLRETFVRFLQHDAHEAAAIYLLGDLFEYWIGDDAGLTCYAAEIIALRQLADAGVRVYFMHGNRDFLVGARFAEASGVIILPDPTRITLCGVPTLLSHGDLFCTDDMAYQRWRRIARNRSAQSLLMLLPQALRQRIAGAARARSTADKSRQEEAIMDVNSRAIETALTNYDAARLIHGHTHRPAEHLHKIEGTDRERIVLADWTPDRCEILVADDTGLHRRILLDPANRSVRTRL